MTSPIDVAKVWDVVKKKPNVVGVSGTLKPKMVGGSPTSTLAIRVYVSKKLPKYRLSPSDLIPSSLKLDGITFKTDVIEIGELKAFEV